MRERNNLGLIPIIAIDRSATRPLYIQIYEGLRSAITSGRLSPGQRLPSTRVLAAEWQISRYPVFSAFEQLLNEGYFESKVGSGTFVSHFIPDELDRPIVVRRPTASPVAPANGSTPHHEPHSSCPSAPFTVCAPALDAFPRHIFSRLIRRHAENLSSPLLAFGDPAGDPRLREAVADYLRTSRAVDCHSSQVLIVAGSQMGLALSAMALADPGTSACVEEPGYPGARRALELASTNIIPIPVDHHGIDVGALASLDATVSVVHITPSHQYPLGVTMELPRRLELLNWATQRGVWIIENDHGSEFHFSHRPLGALQGMDMRGRVIYVGSFSQVVFPGLRLGYVVVPPDLIQRFLVIRETIDGSSPALYQLALTDFLTEGHFARHVRRMRAVYLARRNAMISAIHETAADVLSVTDTDTGLHIVASLPDGVDDQMVVQRAGQHGMFPVALSTCYATIPSRAGLIMGFGGADEASVSAAVAELGSIIRALH